MERVLSAMERHGLISAEEHRLASASPLDLARTESAFRTPHLMAALARTLTAQRLSGAAVVETTIDLELQTAVENAMREEIRGLSDRNVGNAAAIVIDNASGEVLAYAGSVDFLDEAHGGQNDGVRSRRQPGSALKPFAYGLALMEGMTPATILSDVETHLSTQSGTYVPRNYDRRVHGPVRLRAALANSYNVPAVQLMDLLGPERVLSVMHSAGFDSLNETADHYGVGLILGNGEVTLREMARAYRGLARGGVCGPITEIRSVRDAAGRRIPLEPERGETRFLAPDAVALLTDILADEAARVSAFGQTNALRMPFPVAAKTGTSRAHIDNWVAGFTRERTVAVWVGNFNGKPMKNVSGITGAGPVFRRVMLLAMEGIRPEPLLPEGGGLFQRARICPLSGELATDACPGAILEKFLPGTVPGRPCSFHLPDGTLSLPPQFEAWARAEGYGVSSGRWDPADNGRRAARPPGQGESPRRARFLIPLEGDEFLMDARLPAESQTVSIRVSPPSGAAHDALFIELTDGSRLGLDDTFSARAMLPQGTHVLRLWERGAEAPCASVRFRVR